MSNSCEMPEDAKLRCPRCRNGRIMHMQLHAQEGGFLQCMACNLCFLGDNTVLQEDRPLTIHDLHTRLTALEQRVEQMWYAPGAPGSLDALRDFEQARRGPPDDVPAEQR